MGNREQRRTRQRSRAGALIRAHLDWLDGYPVDEGDVRVAHWQTVPRDGSAPRVVALDGRMRARALRVARTIFREEREVLERTVPDAERWLDAVELAVRGDPPWPLYSRRDAAFVRDEHDTFAWLCAARGEIELVRAWADHRETFETVAERIDLPFALQLCRLTTRLRPAVVLPLLRSFQDPLTYEVATVRPPKTWERTPPTPIPRGPSALIEPLRRLVCEALAEPRSATVICRLWGIFEPSFILREWNAFWTRLEYTRASVDRELRLAFEQRRACRIAAELKRELGTAPPAVDIEPIIDSILRIARRPAVAAGAARALRAAMAPWSQPVRSRASEQTRAAHRPTRSRGRYNQCAAALQQWSHRQWAEDAASMMFRAIEDDPFDLELLAMLQRSHHPTRLRIMLRARQKVDPAKRNLVTLHTLANAGASVSQIVALHDHVEPSSWEAIRAALRLTDDVETLREILPRLANRPCSHLDALARIPRPTTFVAAHLKDWILLARLAVGLDRQTLLALQPRPLAHSTQWIRAYPDSLWPALERLAAVEPRAEIRAAKLLAPDLRAPEDIRRELTRLPERAHERRSALLDRLRNPSMPTPERLDRLASKVENAAELTFIQRWTVAIEAHLRSQTDVDLEPEMLAALRTLKRPMRRLAERVLLEGDLRDAPANARYLRRMRQLGVKMQPWLDGIGVHELAGCSFALEDDPVEVLKMGGYFQTCLSPGAFNFFAAVVDAADVNKRVLYARDSRGVAVRVLLALDARGELVRYETFHRKHSSELEDAVSTFVLELLIRMGTRYAPLPDYVEPLMADRWYSDCPLPAPAGDQLESALAAAPESNVVGHLTRSLEECSIELTPATIAALLERAGRVPGKAEAILRLALERRDELPDDSLRTATRLAEGLGDKELAAALVGDRAPRLLWNRYRNVDHFVAKLMLERDPRELLQCLRGRRRGWRRETRPPVLLYAGRALIALRRPRKGRALLQRAADLGSKGAMRLLRE